MEQLHELRFDHWNAAVEVTRKFLRVADTRKNKGSLRQICRHRCFHRDSFNINLPARQATGFCLALVCLLNSLIAQQSYSDEPSVAKSHRFDPVVREIEGWKVHVEPSLLAQSDGSGDPDNERTSDDRSLVMLANHLQRITILLNPDALDKLRHVEIWIERNHPVLESMQYHPSRSWLIAHEHDERLTRKVHIPQADQLLSKEQMLKHPAVILHELSHAYHDQFLGFDNPEIIAVFEAAKQAKIYEDVLLYTGQRVKHYGLSNHKEYFAEGTEAYFYRNDFYPFVRAELFEHDRGLHDLLQRVWSETSQRRRLGRQDSGDE